MLGNMLDTTCQIQQRSTTPTSMGGNKRTYTVRVSSAPCSLKAKTLKEVDVHGKMILVNMYRFYLEYNSTNSAIEHTDRLVFDGADYDIQAINNVAGKNRLLQIDALRVE